MAFNWQTFRTRTLTAIVFVAIMAVGLFWNQWSFFILFSIVHWGAWIEYQKLVSRFNPDYANINGFHRWGVIAAGWLLMLFFTHAELQIGGVRLNEVAWWLGLLFLFLFPLVQLFTARAFFIKNISYSIAGLIYISLSLGLLVDMRNRWTEEEYNTLGLTLPLLTIFTLWINDTMAYIVGSLIGKTPLSKVSPKKTWEGTIGGAILAVIVMSLIAHFTGRLPVIHTAIIAALAAASGTYGDLFESKLKRLAGVKDSGTIMPGHGGFLDRFDSLLFASTVVWFYVVLAF
ncbi:MAG TPA: phosphatidate cytidylyltransferase [Flavisolibacter sp.]|nr:phosphatidate cytidylyltransferase [Flavisolibacter sp.]